MLTSLLLACGRRHCSTFRLITSIAVVVSVTPATG